MDSSCPEFRNEAHKEFIQQHQMDMKNLQTQMVDVFSRIAGLESRSDSKFSNLEAKFDAKMDHLIWYFQKCDYEIERKGFNTPKFVSQGSSSVNDYVVRFEDWNSAIWARDFDVSEEYLVSVFINGLRAELKDLVQILQPQTLPQARAIADLQEGHLRSLRKKQENGRELSEELTNANEVTVTYSSSDEFDTNQTQEDPRVADYEHNLIFGEVARDQTHQEVEVKNGLPCSQISTPEIIHVEESNLLKLVALPGQASQKFTLSQLTENMLEISLSQKLKFSHSGLAMLGQQQFLSKALRVITQGPLKFVYWKEDSPPKYNPIMATLVWFRGPNPGGTRWGPLPILSHYILEDKDVLNGGVFVMTQRLEFKGCDVV